MSTTTRTISSVLAGAVLAGMMLTSPAFAGEEVSTGSLSDEKVAAIKAASDPDPFTAAEIKTAHAESAAKDKQRADGINTLAYPASSYLTANHVPQTYSNYCGPATARMTILHQGVSISQTTLSRATSGRSWADRTCPGTRTGRSSTG